MSNQPVATWGKLLETHQWNTETKSLSVAPAQEVVKEEVILKPFGREFWILGAAPKRTLL